MAQQDKQIRGQLAAEGNFASDLSRFAMLGTGGGCEQIVINSSEEIETSELPNCYFYLNNL